MTAFEKQTISFSPQALNEQELVRLAADAVDAAPGALVGCGAMPMSRVGYLANLGVAYNRDVYLSEAPGIAQLLGVFREKGYSCSSLDLEQPILAPRAISLLYIRERRLAGVRTVLERLSPFLAGGSATVVEGLEEDPRGLLEPLGALGIEIREAELRSAEGSFAWWVKPPAGGPKREPPAAAASPSPPPRQDELVILCIPDLPGGKFASMCELAGYRPTNDISEAFHIAIKWLGETFTPAGEVLRELSAVQHVINGGCEDISKTHVEAVHRALFGYGLMVDPTLYAGPAVMKSNLNAQCRESVVTCPLPEAAPGFVYQKLIVTQPEPAEFEEYRVPVTGSEIPCVVIKRRPVARRFDRTAGHAELASATEVFSAEEIGLLLEFCRRMGMDFGDLDVLRDRFDQRIYVIDANPTPGGPGGPGGGYTAEQRQQLLRIQGEALDRYFAQVQGMERHP